MGKAARHALKRWQHALRMALQRVEVIALFPILVLVAFAAGDPRLVVVAGMVLPSLLALVTLGAPVTLVGGLHAPVSHGQPTPANRGTMMAMLDRISAMAGLESACFMVEIDDWDDLERQLGRETARDVHDECIRRLRAALRSDDLVADLGPASFGVVLHPIAAARLSVRGAIADRLRAEVGAPIGIGETSLRLTACVGHAALADTGLNGADDVIAGAANALREAQAAGPGSVRAYVPGQPGRERMSSDLSRDVDAALASGEILPWFQPQIDARTGEVAGFEALARWRHPTLGVLTPGRFLEAVEIAGRLDALATLIRQQALEALRALDRLDITDERHMTVSVNACGADLRNPSYAEQVAWDLDAADIRPDRLIVEVLESVAGDARDDAVMSTLAALRSQGIGLDLDDFGVGQASLLSIRRFGVRRIKVDRSFVIGIDRDSEQQAMVAGIVSLATKMGLETVAEGVETRQEQAMLSKLGCTHLQGFGIARPMPLPDALAWVSSRASESPPAEGSTIRARPAE